MARTSIGIKSANLVPLFILRILQEKTEPDKAMSAADVKEELKQRYKITCDKRTVRHNLDLLEADAASNVCCTKKNMTLADGTLAVRKTAWRINKPPLFERSELVYLAEGIAASQKLNAHDKAKLITKLEGISAGAPLDSLKNARSTGNVQIDNEQFLSNLELIDAALGNIKQVAEARSNKKISSKTRKKRVDRAREAGTCLSFHLCEHDLDGTLFYPEDEVPYLVDPEFIAVQDGRYYLVAIKHGTDSRRHFRIDMIKGMELVTDMSKRLPAQRKEKEVDIQTYLNRHLFGYGSPAPAVTLRVRNDAKTKHHLFDRFGTDVEIKPSRSTDEHLVVIVHGNTVPMQAWVMAHDDAIEVLTPKSLRNSIRDAAVELAKKYKG